MIYFAVNRENVAIEGIGATFQYEIVCYILSKLHGVGFYFEGIKKSHHYQYYNITEEQWCDDANYFFNFPINFLNLPTVDFESISNPEEFIRTNDNVIIKYKVGTLMSIYDNKLSNLNINQILHEMSSKIQLHEELKYFDDNAFNIALHIRKYTMTDNDPHPKRELFSDHKIPYYKNLINNIKKLKPEFVLHVYSQGEEDEFKFLKNYNTIFHIEEHPLISLYHMINSDVLITANSSLSFIAHLLGNQTVRFCRNTFFHKWREYNTIFLNDDGNFDENKFLELIKKDKKNGI